MHPPGRRHCDTIMSRKTLRKIKEATYNNDHEKLKKLLANRSSRFCAQAMLFALRKGAKDIARIKRGTKIADNEEALAAVKIKNEELVKLFLDFGANVNATIAEAPYCTNSAFDIACKKASVEIVKMMIDRGADLEMTSDEYLPIQSVFQSSDIDKINLFLDIGVDAAEINRLHLFNSLVSHRNVTRDVVERLLQLGADANGTDEQGTSVLASACVGTLEIVKLLVENGADVNKTGEDGKTVLEYAVGCDDKFKIVEYLLKQGAAVNRGKIHPLCIAAQSNDQEICELLLNHGANINGNDDSHITPVVTAVIFGYKRVVKLLLDRGAEHTDLLLHRAIEHDQTGVVKLLLSRGMNPNSVQWGRTALCTAAEFRREEIVKLLLDHGAEVNEISEDGRFPLYHAAFYVDQRIAKLLLDRGADINIKLSKTVQMQTFTLTPKRQEDSLTLALKRGNFGMAKLLVRHAVLLKSKGLYVSPSNLNVAKAYKSIFAFQEECVKEVELLMEKKFDNSDLTYFDVLKIENVDKLAALASNENIVQTLKSNSFLIDFAIYGEAIVKQFNKGILRNKDFVLIKRLFNYLSNRDHDQLPNLHFTVVCKIFTYLSFKDVDKFRNL